MTAIPPPIVAACFLALPLQQTQNPATDPYPAAWPSTVDGKPTSPATSAGPTHYVQKDGTRTPTLVQSTIAAWWQQPGISTPSVNVPAGMGLTNLPDWSRNRYTGHPCYLPYAHRFTNDEIDRLTNDELCSEMEMALCWDDTHYLARLTANLGARIITPQEPQRLEDEKDACVQRRRIPVPDAQLIERMAAGRPYLDMSMTMVLLTTKTGWAEEESETEDALGTHTTWTMKALVTDTMKGLVSRGGTLVELLPQREERAAGLIPVATFMFTQPAGEATTHLTWWKTYDGGLKARRDGFEIWRTNIGNQLSPEFFQPEPPPAPPADQPPTQPATSAQLPDRPGDGHNFTRPLPVKPASTPAPAPEQTNPSPVPPPK